MLTCTGLHLVATEERKLTTSQNIIRNSKREYKIRDILQIYRHKTKPNVFIVDHVTRRLVIHVDTETEREQWLNSIVAQMVRVIAVENFRFFCFLALSIVRSKFIKQITNNCKDSERSYRRWGKKDQDVPSVVQAEDLF